MRRLSFVVVFTACGDTSTVAPPPTQVAGDASVAAAPAQPDPHAATREAAPCADPALHVEAGVELGWLCDDEITKRGLTRVDMSEHWAPLPFAGGDGKPPPKFRETYLALAAEQDPQGDELAPEERLVEMYGITPAWSVVLRRLTNTKRHACHDAIDGAPLAAVKITKPIHESKNIVVEARDKKRRYLGKTIAKQKKPNPRRVAEWTKLQAEHDAIVVVQRHLVCDKLLGRKWTDGIFKWNTGNALELYQREHFLMPDGKLDAETQAAILAGNRELDFRAALRVLRERVVDATGLIEDGSAGSGPEPVLGRPLEPAAMRVVKGHTPLPGAAPDLIGQATTVAATALGWNGADGAQAFLERHAGEAFHVALALPPPPPYHASHMELRAMLDRGDVWYDEKPRHRDPQRRPALILFARVNGEDLPLVRWPSTIGGWADQKTPSGRIREEWKESEVGPRIWKELYVAPTWQPPKTTPDEELVKNLWPGWRLKTESMGPGARSAYGMVMLINHEVRYRGKGKKRVRHDEDHGIRVHGTSTVTSVARGTSHGCHRLLNHLAVRLGSFLLRHRDHVRKGDQPSSYRRIVRHKGESYPIRIDTRGYLYELTPPVPIDVTKGRIRSERKKPPRPR